MKNRSKVYLWMFLSYVGILSVPILLGIVIYGYTSASVRRQAEKLNTSLLMMVQRDLDKEIDNIQKISARLALDNNVQMASRVKKDFGSEDQLTLYHLFNDLQAIAMSEEFIEDIFVYFNNTQKVSCINGNMSSAMYYDLYYKSEDFPFEKFKDYMSGFHYNDVLSNHKKSGGDVLVFTMTILYSDIGEKSATIGIAVDYESIRQRLVSMKWAEGMNVLVMDENDMRICADQDNAESQRLTYDSLTAGNHVMRDGEGKPYIVSAFESNKAAWKYVAITPMALIDGEAKEIQRIAVLGLFLCVITGFAISGYLTRKNYNPVKMLLETMKNHGGREIETNENEYQWLNSQINLFFQEQVNTERLLSFNRKSLKNYYLIQLLQDYYDGRPMEPYGIELKLDYNVVILFESDAKKEDIEENALQKFVITNVFKEMCLKYFYVEMVEIGERVAAVVNLPTGESQYIQVLKELAENLQQLTEDSFGFVSKVFIGSICRGLDGIHLSYQQAYDMEEYLNLLDTSFVIYDEVKNIQPEYDYPVDLEEKIINAMRVGDSRQAVQTMRRVFDMNLAGQVSTNIYRCLIYDMIGTLLKGANSGGYREAARELDLPDQKALGPVEEVKRQFEILLVQICIKVTELQKETSQDKTLSKNVQSFIQENYMDPDLNISITGQHFDMTPAYLSSIYKKQTCGSLLDYINTVRIEHAEQFLEEGMSVVEAAERTGFRDSGTFIRAFKKKKGITPGQLKKKI
jgi:AraC-like DNA-binding protein